MLDLTETENALGLNEDLDMQELSLCQIPIQNLSLSQFRPQSQNFLARGDKEESKHVLKEESKHGSSLIREAEDFVSIEVKTTDENHDLEQSEIKFEQRTF